MQRTLLFLGTLKLSCFSLSQDLFRTRTNRVNLERLTSLMFQAGARLPIICPVTLLIFYSLNHSRNLDAVAVVMKNDSVLVFSSQYSAAERERKH